MSEPSIELINRIIKNIADTHDTTDPNTGIWAHVRRDMPAFVAAVKAAFVAEAMRVTKTKPASPIVDQPMPVASKLRPSWPLVIAELTKMFEVGIKNDRVDAKIEAAVKLVLADMADRDRIGRERYGEPLTAGNGRKHLVDAYQEQLDFVVYIRTWLEENGIDPLSQTAPTDERHMIIATMYFEGIQRIALLRELIDEGL